MPTFNVSRLNTGKLKPTVARRSVLTALQQVAPRCLDARQLYRILNSQFERLAQATIYRVLNDLWGAGLLIRTEGTRGRALFAFKPDRQDHQKDTLRCHCGEKLVFIEDGVLRDRLLFLASREGFKQDSSAVFTITIICAQCPHA
ncbi:Fur family transcriptional regulator [Pantoea sp. B65]|uniref:Fur family transcriptional regulator n=1 Tax=Pantoea sp. B65 TaxID=2813359 RepID=UPI0039B66C44